MCASCGSFTSTFGTPLSRTNRLARTVRQHQSHQKVVFAHELAFQFLTVRQRNRRLLTTASAAASTAPATPAAGYPRIL